MCVIHWLFSSFSISYQQRILQLSGCAEEFETVRRKACCGMADALPGRRGMASGQASDVLFARETTS